MPIETFASSAVVFASDLESARKEMDIRYEKCPSFGKTATLKYPDWILVEMDMDRVGVRWLGTPAKGDTDDDEHADGNKEMVTESVFCDPTKNTSLCAFAVSDNPNVFPPGASGIVVAGDENEIENLTLFASWSKDWPTDLNIAEFRVTRINHEMEAAHFLALGDMKH